MKILKLFILSIIVNILFVSCKKEKPEYPKFVFVFNSALTTLEQGADLPNSIKSIANYYEITDEDSKCNGKLFAPNIVFSREDLGKSVDMGLPLSRTGKWQKKAGTLSIINLKSMYDLNLIKIPKLLTKENTKNTDTSINKKYRNTLVLNIDVNKDSLTIIRKKIENLLCNGVSQITLIIDTKEQAETGVKKPTTGGNIPEGTDICGDFTLPSMMELRAELQKIIDTSRSLNERATIAEKTWNKYFDADAYVAKYIALDDKNPEVWNPGEGKSYFISRIALLKSIININIIRVEYSKDNNRISGIKIVECHASEQMEALQLAQ